MPDTVLGTGEGSVKRQKWPLTCLVEERIVQSRTLSLSSNKT